jgi:CheY-like chemotaxis protein
MEKPRVLLVEDNYIISFELKSALESMGYKVVSIEITGEDAMREALEKLPDVILMDIKLKGEMTGVESAKLIHAKVKIPIIFISAYSTMESGHDSYTSGPTGFLLKPIDYGNLNEVIESLVRETRSIE